MLRHSTRQPRCATCSLLRQSHLSATCRPNALLPLPISPKGSPITPRFSPEPIDFQPFNFQGYVAKRRTVEYSWEYGFGTRKAATTQPLPDYLLPLRDRVADCAALPRESLVEAFVTDYPPGAPIGWHRDGPQFDVVIGLSLASACRMRFKPYKAEGKLVSVILEPRSLYIMRGLARWSFQHSIPAVEQHRYSVTFRTLRV